MVGVYPDRGVEMVGAYPSQVPLLLNDISYIILHVSPGAGCTMLQEVLP